jgi:DNA topoisomerase VI subunit A
MLQQGKYITAREIYYSKGNILQQGKYTTSSEIYYIKVSGLF